MEELDRDLATARLKQLIKKLGRLPLEQDIPRLRFGDDLIDFGAIRYVSVCLLYLSPKEAIRYLKPLVHELVLQNIGIITAYWRIIPLENGGPLCKPKIYNSDLRLICEGIFSPRLGDRSADISKCLFTYT